MVIDTMDIGSMGSHMDKVSFIFMMVLFMMVIGSKINVKVMEYMKIKMDISIKDNGYMTFRMAKVLKIWKMVLIILDNLKME